MKKLLISDSTTKKLTSPYYNYQQWNEHFNLFNVFTYVLVLIVILCGVSLIWDILVGYHDTADDGNINNVISLDLADIREYSLPDDDEVANPRDTNCRFWDCLNIYRCGASGVHERLTVYVYPLHDYVQESSGKLIAPLTREYYQILEAIVRSEYYTTNPNEACLFVPSIDLLNQNLVDSLDMAGRALASLDYWNNGENHLIFNMISGKYPTFNSTLDVNTDKAILLGAGFDTWSYRAGFDVALPVWSPSLQDFDATKMESSDAMSFRRKYTLVAAQLNIIPQQQRLLETLAEDNSEVLLLQPCSEEDDENNNELKWSIRCRKITNRGLASVPRKFEYPRILSKGTFCLIGSSLRFGQPDFIEMLAYNCIPVIAVDNAVLPFEDVIDWTLAIVRIRETDVHSVLQRVKAISYVKVLELQQFGRWVYQRYFKDLRTITVTALEILEGRIFPHRARNLRQWNTIDTNYRAAQNPLFLPLIAPKSQGFTAVILTYDRVESLFTLIQNLALVPSLQSILVVWNNQKKAPPHLSSYPSIIKPIKVIQTRANKLSNRFYPYAEIETEAILTIDDDIIMLTADELDFGFEVWREFPDRIVGFPSRVHVWNNETMRWQYESEWTNQISMVLTGAAFHHKFWSHMYTYAMPDNIKEWVDEHMNCEDIAMNFLVANITNNPPIKVTPRKKFKCPECTNTENLSADLDHMRERSDCIDRFARIYGRMPLRAVEFRADPVLFRDSFPDKLKRFNDVGSL